MSTQNVGNVRVYAANTKKNKHDFNHRVDTTCGLGDVFPVVNLELAAGESPNTKIEALAWLAPHWFILFLNLPLSQTLRERQKLNHRQFLAAKLLCSFAGD